MKNLEVSGSVAVVVPGNDAPEDALAQCKAAIERCDRARQALYARIKAEGGLTKALFEEMKHLGAEWESLLQEHARLTSAVKTLAPVSGDSNSSNAAQSGNYHEDSGPWNPAPQAPAPGAPSYKSWDSFAR